MKRGGRFADIVPTQAEQFLDLLLGVGGFFVFEQKTSGPYFKIRPRPSRFFAVFHETHHESEQILAAFRGGVIRTSGHTVSKKAPLQAAIFLSVRTANDKPCKLSCTSRSS